MNLRSWALAGAWTVLVGVALSGCGNGAGGGDASDGSTDGSIQKTGDAGSLDAKTSSPDLAKTAAEDGAVADASHPADLIVVATVDLSHGVDGGSPADLATTGDLTVLPVADLAGTSTSPDLSPVSTDGGTPSVDLSPIGLVDLSLVATTDGAAGSTDLAVVGSTDLALPGDAAVPDAAVPDLGSTGDLLVVVLPDLAVPVDLAVSPDLRKPADLAVPPDLTHLPDLVQLPDLQTCVGPSGCYQCAATTDPQFLNHCTTANCSAFDNHGRLPLLNADGTLPPLL